MRHIVSDRTISSILCLRSTKIFIFLIVINFIGIKYLLFYYESEPSRNDDRTDDYRLMLETMIMLNMKKRLSLRYDWTNLKPLSPLSPLSKQIDFHQTKQCHLPLANFRYRNQFGLGSDLHLWSQAICNGLETGYRVRTKLPWIWMDKSSCMTKNNDDINLEKQKLSAMSCYFPKSELVCPNDVTISRRENTGAYFSIINYFFQTRGLEKIIDDGKIINKCPNVTSQYGTPEIRAASTEFLFTKVSQLIYKEAERQLNLVFVHRDNVPNNLITVHIRWGGRCDSIATICCGPC
jgi:hypothetical protein